MPSLVMKSAGHTPGTHGPGDVSEVGCNEPETT